MSNDADLGLRTKLTRGKRIHLSDFSRFYRKPQVKVDFLCYLITPSLLVLQDHYAEIVNTSRYTRYPLFAFLLLTPVSSFPPPNLTQIQVKLLRSEVRIRRYLLLKWWDVLGNCVLLGRMQCARSCFAELAFDAQQVYGLKCHWFPKKTLKI